MRVKLIGCQSTKHEVLAIKCRFEVDYDFMDFSLHAFPDRLHAELQRKIDASQEYDLIILTYGRCSHVLSGLISRAVPLVHPAVHDCISLLLGSDSRRQGLEALNPAVYYFSQGWLEYGRDPYEEYIEYLDKYGKDDASYLIGTLYGRYHKAMFIRTRSREELTDYRQRVKIVADFFNWEIEEADGNLALLAAVINAEQHPDVIRVAPGKSLS